MRIGPSLILAGRQTLAMTPQLQQAIKLLQFSHLELAAFIQQELEKNPLLQEGRSDDGPATEPEPPVSEAPADTAEVLAAAAVSAISGSTRCCAPSTTPLRVVRFTVAERTRMALGKVTGAS